MDSYEDQINHKLKNDEDLGEKISIPMLKYFWQMNPLTNRSKDTIPKFLKNIAPFKNFADHELFYLSKYFHMRTFEVEEKIFSQGDVGVGFYLIFQGDIEITAKNLASDVHGLETSTDKNKTIKTPIAILERNDYFGELALLQDSSLRTASAVAKTPAILLGIFKPDLEMLINDKPKIAAKLLQSISLIVANRLYLVTKEVKMLKYRLGQKGEKERRR